jgi:hypothetical protein
VIPAWDAGTAGNPGGARVYVHSLANEMRTVGSRGDTDHAGNSRCAPPRTKDEHPPWTANESHAVYQTQAMKKQLIRISILQSSKIMTALYVLMGFLYSIVGVPMILFGNKQIRIIGIIYLFGPILAGILGFIFFVIFAAIYNLLAGWLGGFEVEIKNID